MFLAVLIALGISFLLILIRLIIGKTTFDRILAANCIGTIIVLGISIHGLAWQYPDDNNNTVTVITSFDVQWGVSDVHIGVRVEDAVVGDGGVVFVPGILVFTPVPPGSQRINLEAQGLYLGFLLLRLFRHLCQLFFCLRQLVLCLCQLLLYIPHLLLHVRNKVKCLREIVGLQCAQFI